MSQTIPHPTGVPLLGNIFDVNPSNTWLSLQRLAETHGEIFQITVLGQTIVFVASAALAGELCDETRFRKYVGGPIVEIRAAVHDALFTAYDHEESWGVAHRILAPRLSPTAVAEWCGEVVDVTGESIAKLKEVGGGKDGVLLMDELNRLNLEATTLTLFGKRLWCITAPTEHPMIGGMENSTSEAMKRPTRPGLLNKLVFGSKFKSAIRVMREEYAEDLVAYRRQNPTDRKDVLAALLEGTDTETGKRLSESQVIDEIVSMPIGSSTAPCLVASAVYFLLKNPGCLAKARAELDEVLGPWSPGAAAAGDNTTKLTPALLARLPYMEGIVRESLRLSFAAPGFNIEPIPQPGSGGGEKAPPVLLGGGKYSVAHNQTMIIVLAGVNRDPAVFADPLAFRPERMMGADFAALPAAVKKWFGNGKRECIGKHWAWQFNMVVLSMLVRECDFEAVDERWELDGRQDGWFNLRPVEFRARALPRKG
ncbi:hypothetical protein N0V93_008083 [Gnomoniopsis smithogilvyi]|uniref:Cytochrome P450 n=1 Tax=Gnomoniopsis smithogilvyi TaxID=1191159 RepID=A0A9W8YM04_9PEZI|nr:hypothetical protein N0V93_008083 [Gnomoniopsis smithogilvyi]